MSLMSTAKQLALVWLALGRLHSRDVLLSAVCRTAAAMTTLKTPATKAALAMPH